MGVNGLSMPVPFVNLELPLYTLFQNQMTVLLVTTKSVLKICGIKDCWQFSGTAPFCLILHQCLKSQTARE